MQFFSQTSLMDKKNWCRSSWRSNSHSLEIFINDEFSFTNFTVDERRRRKKTKQTRLIFSSFILKVIIDGDGYTHVWWFSQRTFSFNANNYMYICIDCVVGCDTTTIIFACITHDSSLNMYGPHAWFDQCVWYESVRKWKYVYTHAYRKW